MSSTEEKLTFEQMPQAVSEIKADTEIDGSGTIDEVCGSIFRTLDTH